MATKLFLCIAATTNIVTYALPSQAAVNMHSEVVGKCVWDGTGCYDDGCKPEQRQENCAKFGQEEVCKSDIGADSRCTWAFGGDVVGEVVGEVVADVVSDSESAVPVTEPKPKGKESRKNSKMGLVRANDQINLQPMRDCSQCWECYACTHDEHYGTVGNCVPILGCIPSQCENDAECGSGRACVHGACKNQSCSVSADCGSTKKCYYGECRDSCSHSSECSDNGLGDICEHGMCGMYHDHSPSIFCPYFGFIFSLHFRNTPMTVCSGSMC